MKRETASRVLGAFIGMAGSGLKGARSIVLDYPLDVGRAGLDAEFGALVSEALFVRDGDVSRSALDGLVFPVLEALSALGLALQSDELDERVEALEAVRPILNPMMALVVLVGRALESDSRAVRDAAEACCRVGVRGPSDADAVRAWAATFEPWPGLAHELEVELADDERRC